MWKNHLGKSGWYCPCTAMHMDSLNWYNHIRYLALLWILFLLAEFCSQSLLNLSLWLCLSRCCSDESFWDGKSEKCFVNVRVIYCFKMLLIVWHLQSTIKKHGFISQTTNCREKKGMFYFTELWLFNTIFYKCPAWTGPNSILLSFTLSVHGTWSSSDQYDRAPPPKIWGSFWWTWKPTQI